GQIVIEDSRAAADDRLAIVSRRPAEADARRQVHSIDARVGVMQVGCDVAAIGNAAGIRTLIAGESCPGADEIREAIRLANGVGVMLAAQRQSDLQVRGYVPL